jgi:hypothetical protein
LALILIEPAFEFCPRLQASIRQAPASLRFAAGNPVDFAASPMARFFHGLCISQMRIYPSGTAGAKPIAVA